MSMSATGSSSTAVRPTRRRPRAVVLAALALLAIAFVAVATQPWWLGALVGRQLAASSARDVRIGRMWISLTAALEPVAHFRDVRIENAPWADRSRPFADLGAASARFSWRSVAERRPVIDLLVLRDGTLDLERERDGLRNWRLRDPEDRGPGRYKVLAIAGERATVRFRHAGIDLDLEARAVPNDAADARNGDGDALPSRLDAKGDWRGVGFAVNVETGPVLTFLETGQTFPLRGRIAVGAARVDLDGRAGDLFRAPLLDAKAALVASSLAALTPILGGRWPEARSVRADGRVRLGERSIAVQGLQAQIGKTDLAGDASLARAGERRTIRADLRSAAAELDDLRWLVGAGTPPRDRRVELGAQAANAARATRGKGSTGASSGSAEANPGAAPNGTTRMKPSAAASVAAPAKPGAAASEAAPATPGAAASGAAPAKRGAAASGAARAKPGAAASGESAEAAANAASTASARAVTGSASTAAASASGAASAPSPGGIRFYDVRLKYAARQFRASPSLPLPLQGVAFEATLADGRLTLAGVDVGIADGRATGDASADLGASPPAWRGELAVRGVRVDRLLGAAAAKAQLSGAMSGKVALQASGRTVEALLRSLSGTVSAALGAGTIGGLLDAELGLQGGRIVRNLLLGAEPVGVRCAQLVLDVQRGVGRVRSFVFDTERTRTTGSGSVDFGERRLDLVLTPEAKQRGLFNLDRSIRLQGPWSRPARSLVERAAPAGGAAGCASAKP